MNKSKLIYPNHLQIEIVAGLCSARCIMCPIDKSPRTEIMDNEKFKKIINSFEPIKKHLKFTTLHGLGEPLLDKGIVEKVAYAKQMGLPSVGFATNGTHLTEELSIKLLNAKLDTLIFSIDGIKKETHEAIRLNTNYDEIVENTIRFINLRNKIGNTKIIVRMVKQESNKDEWDEYFNFWKDKLSSKYGDQVSAFDIHNRAGDCFDLSKELKELSKTTTMKCSDLYERMLIRIDGTVSFCCADYKDWFKSGSVLKENPLDIYNRDKFKYYREEMKNGNIACLEHCKDCSIIFSRYNKKYLDI